MDAPLPNRHSSSTEKLATVHALGLLDLAFEDFDQSLEEVMMERPGDKLGPYCLMEKIGEGGFGVVWRAEQSEPIRREVAVKVIRPGMDSTSVLARFRAEQRVLERLSHPNIAAVLDAGVTPNGRPFFVLELVRGRPITHVCAEAGLDLRQRLELFLEVCAAVQHAHQRAILHRDLKPANLLVFEAEDRLQPKVIDFGVAKALVDEETPDSLMRTRQGMVLGTPLYMAPEQAAADGNAVDVRVDVYALGSILYELITGTPPLAQDENELVLPFSAQLKRVLEVEPPAPSQRIQQRLKAGLPVPCRPEAVCEDLDWILWKALEKDPNHRYATVNELAEDVRRHLRDEPVSVGAPDFWYLLRKRARRNKTAFVIGAVAALNLLLLTGISICAFVMESRARERAEAESQKAKAVVGFMSQLLQQAGAFVGSGKNPEALSLAVHDSLEEIDKLKDQPAVRVELLEKLADIYIAMGDHQRSLPLVKQQAEESVRLYGEKDPRTLIARQRVARAIGDIGDKDQAFQIYKELAESWRQLGPEYEEQRDSLGRLLAKGLARMGKRKEAIDLAYQSIPMGEKGDGWAVFLAELHVEVGELDQAERVLEQAISQHRKAGDEHENSLLMRALSRLRARQGRYDLAAQALEQCIRLSVAKNGGDYHSLVNRWIEVSRLYLKTNRLEDAFRANDEALAIARGQSNQQKIARALRAAAEVREQAGYREAALAYRRECMQIERLHNVDRGKWIYELTEIVRLESLLGLHAEAERDALVLWKNAQLEPAAYTDPPFMRSICKTLAEASERWQAATGRQPHPEAAAQWRSVASSGVPTP